MTIAMKENPLTSQLVFLDMIPHSFSPNAEPRELHSRNDRL